jgi:hypothetical protein
MIKNKTGKLVTLMAVSSLSAVSSAALPTAASTALTSIGTGITDTETAVWPLIGAALVAGIVIKLVKRFSNKI